VPSAGPPSALKLSLPLPLHRFRRLCASHQSSAPQLSQPQEPTLSSVRTAAPYASAGSGSSARSPPRCRRILNILAMCFDSPVFVKEDVTVKQVQIYADSPSGFNIRICNHLHTHEIIKRSEKWSKLQKLKIQKRAMGPIVQMNSKPYPPCDGGLKEMEPATLIPSHSHSFKSESLSQMKRT